MAKSAILLCEGTPTAQHVRLAQILEFFGVPHETVDVGKPIELERVTQDCVVFGLNQTVAAALKATQRADRAACRPAAFYAYTSDDRKSSEEALQWLCKKGGFLLRPAPVGNVALRVSRELPDLGGPMAGLEISSQLRTEDSVLAGVTGEQFKFATVISAGGAPVFVRFERDGVPVYFCASSTVVDIDQAVGPDFYDVKRDFCSVVPLVMFVKFMFSEVGWRPQELGACLIIDDPLLKQRYGYCDFGVLRDLSRRYGFTTNIAFIPWNWRRTSHTAADFFRDESESFSVSIHGCDHIGAEFGSTSPAVLDNKAKLAQSRMRNHEARTGIHHDPVMVFPQGVFSSVCPGVLKRNGFLAAVNTETVPSDSNNVATRIRDVWDVAIMKYGGFPILTRRYSSHGLENFAFDLLLGKPCLIVSHHDFFKQECAELIELIEKLQTLNCSLRWRPLGEVIRRSCRRRIKNVGEEEVEMYGNELTIDNASDQMLNLHVWKRENLADLVAEVRCEAGSLRWTANADRLAFEVQIDPRSENHFQVFYREQVETGKVDRSLRFELSVAARRILSEFRDNYLSKSSFLTTTAASLKSALAKAS